MNDLAKFGGGVPATTETLIKGLQNVSQTIQGSSGVAYMRLLKSGAYAYGPEAIEPEIGSHWALNPNSLQHGYACWGDGELLDERMVPFTQDAPLASDLPDYGQPWSQQVAMLLQCVNGEDNGVMVQFKGTSLGLRNATKELINKLIVQLQSDPVNCVPAIELDIDSYQHKKYGEIFFPVFNVVKWLSFEGEEPAAAETTATTTTPSKQEEVASKSSDKPADGGDTEKESKGSRRGGRRRRRTVS